jgi:hypothetical protein
MKSWNTPLIKSDLKSTVIDYKRGTYQHASTKKECYSEQWHFYGLNLITNGLFSPHHLTATGCILPGNSGYTQPGPWQETSLLLPGVTKYIFLLLNPSAATWLQLTSPSSQLWGFRPRSQQKMGPKINKINGENHLDSRNLAICVKKLCEVGKWSFRHVFMKKACWIGRQVPPPP